MNQLFEAAAGAGPFLTAVLVPFVSGILLPIAGLRAGPRDPAAIRSMTRHSKLHDALPEATREPIRKLIEFEAAKYARATMRKGARKFQWSVLWTLIFLFFLFAVAELSLLAAASTWWPAYIVAGLFGGIGGALLSYGFTQLFKYVEGDPLASGTYLDDSAGPEGESERSADGPSRLQQEPEAPAEQPAAQATAARG